MEHFIDENTVMHFYLKELEADHIEFLKGKKKEKQQIADCLNALLAADSMNDKIRIASGLWKLLFAASMSCIDPDKKGYDKLFSYFDEYVEFEELIFASDSFYRDHTLHCMWVYLLGEYIYRSGEFEPIFKTGREDKSIFYAFYDALKQLGIADRGEFRVWRSLIEEIDRGEKLQDSVRCVAALTHDLGYPIKKIDKINRSIGKILPFYAVDKISDYNFTYSNVNQKFIDIFLRLLSTNINYVIRTDDDADGEAEEIFQNLLKIEEKGREILGVNQEFIEKITPEQKEYLVKNVKVILRQQYRYSDAMAYSSDFESYQHGIMSAFLLCKNLSSFRNIEITEGTNIELYNVDYAKLMAKKAVLNSITNHTSENFQISNIKEATFLTFVDELEEFSRISRASQNREYVEEFCDSEIYMDEQGWFCVDFSFVNDELDNLDPKRAFKGRCKRFLTLFNIAELDENLKIRLCCIGKLKKDSSVYQLEIARKHAAIFVDGVEQNIPQYLNSPEFYTREEYEQM